MGKAEHFWAWIGKLSILVGVTGGIAALGARFLTASSDLHATVSFGPFLLPSIVQEDIERVPAIADVSVINDVLKARPDRDPLAAFADAKAVSERLTNRMPSNQLTSLTGIRGYWFVQLSNDGALAAKTIAVRFPEEVIAETRSQGKTKPLGTGDLFEIGQMLPSQELQIVGWSRSTPSIYNADKLVISYSSGLAKTHVLDQVGSLRHWRLQNPLLYAAGATAAFAIVAALFSVLIAVIVQGRQNRVAQERGPPPS